MTNTNYKTKFSYDAIYNLFDRNRYQLECNESRTTNSKYITAVRLNDDLVFEIRISDHEHPNCKGLGSYIDIISEDSFDLNIIDKEGFKKAKEFIQKNK